MPDSLVIAGQIETLGGGVVSDHPLCTGAIFYLRRDFDLSSPPPGSGDIANMLLPDAAGGTRDITLPVAVRVPATGDLAADRTTLAGARELLLEAVAADEWPLTWTRDGGDALVFDCFEASAAVVEYSLLRDRQLVSLFAVTFTALPYGRSTDEETVNFPAPSQNFDQPTTPVVIDGYGTNSNFLSGDASTFDVGIANWVAAVNCTVARVTSPVHAGAGALRLTATGAGNMDAIHCPAANYADFGMECDPGDTITVRAFTRAAVTARSTNTGASFYDQGGAFISTLRGSNSTNSTANFTTQPTATLTAPANAAWAIADLQVVSAAAGEQHYFDDVWIDGGPVYSADDPEQWTSNTQNAVVGTKSARWSRVSRDSPIYDHTLAAAVDITGRPKLTFWCGLATTTSQYATWHRGLVSFSVLLRDGTGQTLNVGTLKRECKASQIPGKPHWQLITFHIPQVSSGFDYTTVSSYRIQVWNHWDSKAVGPAGQAGGRVLQAGLFLNQLSAAPTATGVVATRGAWYQVPGIIGTAPAPVTILAAPGPSAFSTVVEFTTVGSNAFTTGVGVTRIDKAEAWGGGGGGAGGSNNSGGGGGGGGGEYAVEFGVPVLASTSYPATVGGGGSAGTAGNPGTYGGDSYWSGQSGPQVRAHGGHNGRSGNTWGGSQGGSGSTNAVHYAGGNGRQSNVNGSDGGHGGGGGGSGGTSSGGNDGGSGGSSWGGAPAVSGGGPGGRGGGLAASPPFTGSAPTVGPGGGGGGGNDNSGGNNGGGGVRGKVRLTYGASGLLPLASLLLHSPGRDAPETYNPLIPVGNGADTPNGATEYPVPDVGSLNSVYDGTYTIYLIASTWNSPGSSRDLSVVIRQYPYSGGAAVSQTVSRTGVTPNTDITNGYVDMGVVTLPHSAIPPGNTDSYFGITVTSTNTADRFLDVLALDLSGRTLLVNVPGSSIFNSIWVDEPDHDRNLGGIFGSDADRDRAVSAFRYIERVSGGAFAVAPARNNRILAYAAQGCPAIQLTYLPRFRIDRIQ